MQTLLLKLRKADALIVVGFHFIVFALILYLFPGITTSDEGMHGEKFFVFSWALWLFYFIFILTTGRLRKGQNGLYVMFVFLILGLVSCYTLNRELNVFDDNAGWFSIVLIIVCSNFLLFPLFKYMNKAGQYFFAGITGLGLVVFCYLAFYLFPLYVISAVGSFLLGITMHTFVPLLFYIYTLVMMKRLAKDDQKLWRPFLAGAGIPLVIIVVFVSMFSYSLNRLNRTYGQASGQNSQDLPAWVRAGQQARSGSMAETVLKTELVYSVANIRDGNFLWGRMPSANFGKMVHDPLVMISSLLCGKLTIPEDDRIKMLASMYQQRHQTQERLWNGLDLVTSKVATGVELWPSMRLAYSQYDITVSNPHNKERWQKQEEAIYTFHLSEGSVVTSLALWIDGKPQPGILTTRGKAANAYNTIVGKERRDPSVIHWQEGNCVTVRVFPVLDKETRKFSIGVSSPVLQKGGELVYQPAWFEGPPASDAFGETSLRLMDGTAYEPGAGFDKQPDGSFIKKGGYDADWKLALPALPMSDESFSFAGNHYGLVLSQKRRERFSPDMVMLDVNASWTLEECEEAFSLVKEKKVYVDGPGNSMLRLSEENMHQQFNRLRQLQYSLFPFYKIGAIERVLVIGKSGAPTPTMEQLKHSVFLPKLDSFFSNRRVIRYFDLGAQPSAYLATLREFRAITMDQGNLEELQQLLNANQFLRNSEDDDHISFGDGELAIQRRRGIGEGHAPDHLMRLFAYNHLLYRAGSTLLDGNTQDDSLIDEAAQANIVSPVSSLVVLESKLDYESYDIAAAKNTLNNASLKSTGAVPEPHEWALIFLVALFCLYIRCKSSWKPSLVINKRHV